MGVLYKIIKRISPWCQVCGLEDKNTQHLLLDYPFAKVAWLIPLRSYRLSPL
jgi:hypothetical protein